MELREDKGAAAARTLEAVGIRVVRRDGRRYVAFADAHPELERSWPAVLGPAGGLTS